jgi:hypothetical protein
VSLEARQEIHRSEPVAHFAERTAGETVEKQLAVATCIDAE